MDCRWYGVKGMFHAKEFFQQILNCHVKKRMLKEHVYYQTSQILYNNFHRTVFL